MSEIMVNLFFCGILVTLFLTWILTEIRAGLRWRLFTGLICMILLTFMWLSSIQRTVIHDHLNRVFVEKLSVFLKKGDVENAQDAVDAYINNNNQYIAPIYAIQKIDSLNPKARESATSGASTSPSH